MPQSATYQRKSPQVGNCRKTLSDLRHELQRANLNPASIIAARSVACLAEHSVIIAIEAPMPTTASIAYDGSGAVPDRVVTNITMAAWEV